MCGCCCHARRRYPWTRSMAQRGSRASTPAWPRAFATRAADDRNGRERPRRPHGLQALAKDEIRRLDQPRSPLRTTSRASTRRWQARPANFVARWPSSAGYHVDPRQRCVRGRGADSAEEGRPMRRGRPARRRMNGGLRVGRSMVTSGSAGSPGNMPRGSCLHSSEPRPRHWADVRPVKGTAAVASPRVRGTVRGQP